MKNKLKFLVKNNFGKKVKTKWFKIVNIFLLVLIVGLINLNSIITAFGGDFDKKSAIYVNGNETSYEVFKANYEIVSSQAAITNYEVLKLDDSLTLAKENLKDNTSDMIIDINSDNGLIKAEIISYETIDALTYQVVEQSLNSSKTTIYLNNSNLTAEEKALLMSPIEITRTFTNTSLDKYAEAKETLGSILIPLFIIPFFMLVVLLVQFIGADVNEEKSTRSMEIIISNVPPKVHFFSKIIGGTGFVLFQGLLFFIYAAIGLLVKNLIGGTDSASVSEMVSSILEVLKSYGVIDNLIPAIIITIVLFVLSFVAYSLVAGILASMTTSIEDYQQLQGPIMIICVAGYYLAIMASVFEGSVFIKAASYLPFFSSMLSPVLFLLGQITLMDMLISTLIMVGTIYLLIKYGLRIYKIGILNYSSKDLWKKVFKSMKKE